MTTITATCPVCGVVDLNSFQVRLVQCTIADWSYYTFTCPTCGDSVRKPAMVEVCQLLKTGGVVAEPWHVPAEALEQHSGDAISYDEILDFALRLNALTSPLPALMALGPPPGGA
ncbi:hypothetical protein ACPPVT_03405 [Angustibacter sp. McL0619]|uniref:hypothetical protein n=1 Tax=Angustibacter sp. McL0619 TaxID=3415676 RepID=UPI003CFA7209